MFEKEYKYCNKYKTQTKKQKKKKKMREKRIKINFKLIKMVLIIFVGVKLWGYTATRTNVYRNEVYDEGNDNSDDSFVDGKDCEAMPLLMVAMVIDDHYCIAGE